MRELDWKRYEVLVVDDEEDNLDAFRFSFRKSFALHYALGGQAALDLLERVDPAVIVSDQRMPGMSGVDFLRRAKERRPDAQGILLTAYADLSVLIDAVNSGAVERYVHKPWDSKELAVILRQAILSFATLRDNARLRDQLARYAGYLEREQRDPIDFGEIACESTAMKEVARRIAEVAPTTSHVLIEGEPGSEMEVVARAVHVGSPREERPFVTVACAAFSRASGTGTESALERELFGWRRGAFEGAFADRAGRFELADTGTIFLDAPSPLPATLQARMMRLLTAGEVERIGATEPVPADVRVIVGLVPSRAAAWGSDVLTGLVERLGVFSIRLPPLRERPDDIPGLANHFLRKYARRNARAATALSAEALDKLAGYDWPGNTRELENVVERAAVVARGDVICPDHLELAPRASTRPLPTATAAQLPAVSRILPAAATGVRLDSQLDDLERRELVSALERCNGNKAEVARSLGMQRTTLYYRLKRLGIEV